MPVANVLRKSALTLVMSIIAILLLFPIMITFTNSLTTANEIEVNYGPIGKINESSVGRTTPFVNLKLLPDKVSLEQYGKVFVNNPKYLTMFWNSVLLVMPIIAGQTAVGALAAYAFAKTKVPRQGTSFSDLCVNDANAVSSDTCAQLHYGG
jgi:multiple sugar transport system permease protein